MMNNNKQYWKYQEPVYENTALFGKVDQIQIVSEKFFLIDETKDIPFGIIAAFKFKQS